MIVDLQDLDMNETLTVAHIGYNTFETTSISACELQ